MTINYQKIIHHLEEAVFPRFCLSCNEEGQLLCQTCAQNWQPPIPAYACSICGVSSALGLNCYGCGDSCLPDGLLFSFMYADPVARQLICAWKYDFDHSAKEILWCKIDSRLDILRNLIEVAKIEAVIPIPLHQHRFCERGFDQAGMLAEFITAKTDLPALNVLKRVRRTGNQAERSDHERMEQMRQSPFQVVLSAPRRVLLVDDVWTTGATAQAATVQLKNAGAQEVYIYTIARGG